MKKKLVILCIAAAMSVSMLGGCGNSAKTTDSTKTEDTTKEKIHMDDEESEG
jgi:outer membrane murein-binding lipoprotein Lpp